jgi:hypothetical protein
MINFLQEYWLFLTVVLGTILIIVTIYIIFSWRNRKQFPKTQTAVKNVPFPTKEAKILASVNNQENFEEDEQKLPEDQVITPQISEKKEEVLKTPHVENLVKEVKETVIVNNENNNDDEDDDHFDDDNTNLDLDNESDIEDFDDTSEKKEFGAYHIIFRRKDQKWIIKREGSKKIYRTLDTQKEAIAYATIKSIVHDTTYVIHKKDGKIRKQKYYKKEN